VGETRQPPLAVEQHEELGSRKKAKKLSIARVCPTTFPA
jgi:hypothetical protein